MGDPRVIGTIGERGADAPYDLGDGDRGELWDQPLEDEARPHEPEARLRPPSGG